MAGRGVRVTTSYDEETSTVEITLLFPAGSDPDRAADAAWAAVSGSLETHRGIQSAVEA